MGVFLRRHKNTCMSRTFSALTEYGPASAVAISVLFSLVLRNRLRSNIFKAESRSASDSFSHASRMGQMEESINSGESPHRR